MGGLAVVEGQNVGGNIIISLQHSSHNVSHEEVGLGRAGEESFVQPGDLDKWMLASNS